MYRFRCNFIISTREGGSKPKVLQNTNALQVYFQVALLSSDPEETISPKPHANLLTPPFELPFNSAKWKKKITGSLDRKDPWSPWSPWSSQIEPMSQQLSRTQRDGLNGLGQLGRVGHSWSIVLNRKWSDSAGLAPPSTSTPCFMRRCSLLRQSIA